MTESLDDLPVEENVDEPDYAENADGVQEEPGPDDEVEDRTGDTDESGMSPDDEPEPDEDD